MKNEGQPVADAIGVGKQYKELSESGKIINHNQIEELLKRLYEKSGRWIAEKMDEAEPVDSSIPVLNYLNEIGIVKIITKNPLLSISECKYTIEEKLGGKTEIIPTSEIEYCDGIICGGLKNIRKKSEVLKTLIEKYKPDNLFCIGHDINDCEIARYVKERNGTVIFVNPKTPYIKNVSDYYNINSITDLPPLFEEFFKEKLYTHKKIASNTAFDMEFQTQFPAPEKPITSFSS